MSVRQYIGARYVTKIYENTLDPSSAEWQASVNYEPLTMVTYNNGSYLSKKQVPASVGDPASNPTYWVQTGFYNGQIAQLQNDVSDLQGDVLDLQNIIGGLSGQDKHFWLISDSFLRIPSNWGTVVDTWTGETSHKTYEGGAGFNKGGNDTGKTIDQLIADDTSVPDNITDVILYAGCNDCDAAYYNVSTNFGYALANIKAKAPNAKIWVSCNATYLDRDNSFIGDVYTKMMVGCSPNKAVFVKSAWYSIQNKDLTSDDIHPTGDGAVRIALAFLNTIYGGCEINYEKVNTMNGIKFITCQSEYVTLETSNFQTLYSGTGINITQGVTYALTADNTAPVPSRYNYQLAFDTLCRINNGTLHYIWVTVCVTRAGAIGIIPLDGTYSGITEMVSYGAGRCTVPMIRVQH